MARTAEDAQFRPMRGDKMIRPFGEAVVDSVSEDGQHLDALCADSGKPSVMVDMSVVSWSWPRRGQSFVPAQLDAPVGVE